MRPIAFSDSVPVFEPEKFFVGHTHSTGVMETRGGKPKQRITTSTVGTMSNGILYMEQDLIPEGGKPSHRSWQMRRIDAHHIEATANDIVDTAHGVLYGSVFSWSFKLALAAKNPFKRVKMSQTMYLQPGANTLIIRTVIRKAGIVFVQITEEFVKQ